MYGIEHVCLFIYKNVYIYEIYILIASSIIMKNVKMFSMVTSSTIFVNFYFYQIILNFIYPKRIVKFSFFLYILRIW